MKEVDFIDVNGDEYKKRFTSYFTDYGMKEKDAEKELKKFIECMDEKEKSNPEWDAEEIFSYWANK